MELMSQFTESSSNNHGKTKLKKKKKRPASASLGQEQDIKRQLTVDDEGERLTAKPQSGDSQHTDSVSTEEYDSDESGEQYSDEDDDVMDSVIDNNPNNSVIVQSEEVDVDTHAPLSPSSLAAWVDDIFCRDYIVDPPVQHLDAVADKFATTLTSWCRVPPKKDEIKEMFKEALVPVNVEGLHPVKINESLYRKLPLKARINDQRLRELNTFLAWGTGPLAAIFNELCNIETLLNCECKNKIHLNEENVLVIGKTKVNFPDMCRSLGKSIHLLTAAHSNLLQCRKVSLWGYIDKKFHYLTRDTNPMTCELLGSDLEQKIFGLT